MRTRFALFCLLLTSLFSLQAQTPGAGYCIGLDGTSQYLTASHLAAYDVDSSLSLEAWIFPYTLTDNVVISTQGTNFVGQPQGYSFRCGASGNLLLQTPLGSISSPGNVVQTSNWQHVALTFSAAQLKFYVNGMLVHTAAPPASFTAGTIPLSLGRSALGTAPGYFDGELDEVRIWNQTLSEAQIRDWICRKVTPAHPAYANLTGYWRIDNGQGSVASDLSTQNNHASTVNSPMWGWSAAPIGDLSIHSVTPPFALSMPSGFGDTLHIFNAGGSPDALHIYRVDEAPNHHANPTGFAALDTTHYYGVFFVGGLQPTFNGAYAYGGNPFFNAIPDCETYIAVRTYPNIQFWNAGLGVVNATTQQIPLTNYPPLEIIPGHRDNPWSILALPFDHGCLGDTLMMGTSTGAGAYQWFLGANPIPNADSSVYSTTVAGSYSLQVIDNGCTYQSNTINLVFTTPPLVSFGALSDRCIDLAPDSLSGGAPAGGTYGGPGVNGILFDPLQAGLGIHTLSYMVSDSNGCADTAYSTIIVNPAPTAIFSAPADICQLAPPLTLAGGLPTGGVYGGQGVSGGLFEPLLTGPGLIPLEYVVVNPNGCDDTAYAQILVLPAPITPTISAAGNVLNSSSPVGNQWYDSTGAIAGANGQAYTATATGTYYVIVTDSNGCSSDTSLPYVVTFVGVQSGIAGGLLLYPQPAQAELMVGWVQETAGEVEIVLRDLRGVVVRELRLEGNAGGARWRISLEGLAAGLYGLELRSADGVFVGRFVKE